MKNPIKLLLLLLAFLLPVTASAYDEVDGLNYTPLFDYETGLITGLQLVGINGFGSYSGDVTIPDSVELEWGGCYPVVSIGPHAFAGNTGTVNIPGSIKSILGTAFNNFTGSLNITDLEAWCGVSFDPYVVNPDSYFPTCYPSPGFGPHRLLLNGEEINNLVLPNTISSIGEYTFQGCSGLISVTISSSVTSIGEYAFIDCSGLSSITVASGNTKYDSRNNCNAIIETATNTLVLGCKNTVIPNTVTAIGNWAFENCYGLTSIIIPNSVNEIGSCTFKGCI